MGSGQDGQADGVGVLLNDGCGDLLRRLVQARVDDLEAGFPKSAGDYPGATVVTVEPGLGHHHPIDALHRLDTRRSVGGGASPLRATRV